MRLVIPLCKHCLIDKNECRWHRQLRQLFQNFGKGYGTFVHHCQKYYKTIPIGSHVEVELKEIEVDTYGGFDEPEYERGEWVSAGLHAGTVVGRGIKGFLLVKLDKEVILSYPDNNHPNNGWANPHDVEVSHINKRAKEIKILEDKSTIKGDNNVER